ncbi:MAG: succinyl-CoA synthetase subunit beta, partial [Desulfobacterales bacterium]|nr:succinyl-CoA synthetase subunit beta [Desulfobacterales bacterium]
RELYLGVTIDNTRGTPVVMASSVGGIDIEEVATKTPEKIALLHPDILKGIREYETRRLIKQIGLKGKELPRTSSILW